VDEPERCLIRGFINVASLAESSLFRNHRSAESSLAESCAGTRQSILAQGEFKSALRKGSQVSLPKEAVRTAAHMNGIQLAGSLRFRSGLVRGVRPKHRLDVVAPPLIECLNPVVPRV